MTPRFAASRCQHQYQNPAIGVKLAAGCRLCGEERIVGDDVSAGGDESGAGKRLVHEFAFAVDRRIDFVGHSVVSLVAFKSDIVSRGDAPERAAIYLEGRLPHAQMISRHHDAHGFSVSETVILRTSE